MRKWGYSRQLQRAPATLFSVAAFSQLQSKALCFPQEQVALAAQTQASPERPQQLDGSVGAIAKDIWGYRSVIGKSGVQVSCGKSCTRVKRERLGVVDQIGVERASKVEFIPTCKNLIDKIDVK